jgi:DNA polymerase-3 subunit chi
VTKVSYYILGEDSLEARARFAVKFVRQSFRKGLDVHCHVTSESEALTLDQLMWNDDESFIPHEIDPGDSSKAPVGIGWQDPPDRHGVLVNLDGPLPSWFSRFDHLVEIVVQEPKVLETTRTNWKQLKFDGYPITQHDLRS